jgi:hypothetical protein
MSAASYLWIDQNGVVTNLIMFDPSNELTLPAGHELVLCTGQADIGWTRNEDGSFTAPPPAEE